MLGRRELHPTVKPMRLLLADAIMDCTKRGEIVLDGFLGSGSTLIAAERTGRRCYGLELDPGYVDTIDRPVPAHRRCRKDVDAVRAASAGGF